MFLWLRAGGVLWLSVCAGVVFLTGRARVRSGAASGGPGGVTKGGCGGKRRGNPGGCGEGCPRGVAPPGSESAAGRPC
jgi:hypothetical protein